MRKIITLQGTEFSRKEGRERENGDNEPEKNIKDHERERRKEKVVA